jgi:hypothetical protein
MDNNVILLVHPALGGIATLAALWVFVDTLNVSEASRSRIKNISILCAVLMWLTYFIGGCESACNNDPLLAKIGVQN